jgi:hypothetical protein
MNTLRKYLDIISESTLFENPWEGQDPAKAQAWSALTPEDQKWLGGADPTDQFILARAPNKGKPAGAPAPAATQTPVAVDPAPQPAPLKPPSAGASADGNAGELAAQANASAAPAQSGQSVNRDSMTFGQAFKDARNKKEPKFTWKGKEYTTQLAPSKPSTTAPGGLMPAPGSKGQSGMPAQQGGADPMTTSPEYKQLLATLNATFQAGGAESPAYKQAFANFNAFVNKNKPTSESVGYAEDQNLVSIVQLAGLR